MAVFDPRTETDTSVFQEPAVLQNGYVHAYGIFDKDYLSEKFCENPDQHLDDFEYKRNGNDAGLVLIFNQENFDSNRRRRGSSKDVNQLVLTLGRLGYNIEKQYIFTDLTREELKNTFEKLSQQNHIERNSLICVFLTHGGEGNKIEVKDGFVTTEEVIGTFSKCSTLQGKPKLFVFQACKGHGTSRLSTGNYFPVVDSSPKLVPNSIFNTVLDPDLLIVYSTLEGTGAFRNPLKGSWFIQELCQNFNAYGKKEDVISMIIRTTKCVTNNYFHVDEEDLSHIHKQVPLFISTLHKKFYLTNSKERQFFLRFEKGQEENIALIKKLNEKLDIKNQ